LKHILLAVFMFTSLPLVVRAQSKASAAETKAFDASMQHLKVCHRIHKLLLDDVDNMPWKSPLDEIKAMPRPKETAEACAENANQEISTWRGLNEAQQKQQEEGLGRALGFSFDELIEDYNFFNVLSSRLDSPSTE
jgi:hypothetical protein